MKSLEKAKEKIFKKQKVSKMGKKPCERNLVSLVKSLVRFRKKSTIFSTVMM